MRVRDRDTEFTKLHAGRETSVGKTPGEKIYDSRHGDPYTNPGFLINAH